MRPFVIGWAFGPFDRNCWWGGTGGRGAGGTFALTVCSAGAPALVSGAFVGSGAAGFRVEAFSGFLVMDDPFVTGSNTE